VVAPSLKVALFSRVWIAPIDGVSRVDAAVIEAFSAAASPGGQQDRRAFSFYLVKVRTNSRHIRAFIVPTRYPEDGGGI
jgi:hypothetical protein